MAHDRRDPLALERLEQRLFLEGIYERYGYDFRDYAPASLRRRLLGRLAAESVGSVTELLARVLHEPAAMERLVTALTVHVTAMFRDPSFYLAFRRKVVPLLGTYPFVRIWHAGCSTGEEVYSLAIVLREEGIAERCRIYATDLSEAVLARAREGVVSLAAMKEHTTSYQRAGGTAAFSEYYSAKFDHALIRPSLRDNVVFAQHDLVTGASFNEFHLILCRNVMIYFNGALQARVHELLAGSLARLGILALGRKESLRFTPAEAKYEPLDERERLFRKVA